jgi:hypothetical protein
MPGLKYFSGNVPTEAPENLERYRVSALVIALTKMVKMELSAVEVIRRVISWSCGAAAEIVTYAGFRAIGGDAFARRKSV